MSISGIFGVVRQRGTGYFIYVITGFLVPRFVRFLLFLWLPPKISEKILGFFIVSPAIILGKNLEISPQKGSFTQWQDWEVDPHVRARIDTDLRSLQQELILGELDADGRVLSHYGPLPQLENVDQDHFTGRRNPIEIILLNECVLLRKKFQNAKAFLREWAGLALLAGKARVPALYKVDQSQKIIYKNFISAPTMRDLMVKAGAKILSSQIEGLDSEAVWARGREVLSKCAPSGFVGETEKEMNVLHRCGITGVSLTFGNILVDPKDGRPWFIDFDRTHFFQNIKSWAFRWYRNRDRVKFGQIYNENLITEQTIYPVLTEAGKKMNGWYAPLDLGGGVAAGNFWMVEAGTGRWDFLNKEILMGKITGKRILDLGSNNCLMPLLMLREGAREVLAVEMSAENVDAAKILHRVFEWNDLEKYNLKIEQRNMLDILEKDWGRFDLVTAFCSLYYVSEKDMNSIVRRAADLASSMILQAKEDTRTEAADNKSEKSTPLFLCEILKKNGFQNVKMFNKKRYSRPLLIGTKNERV